MNAGETTADALYNQAVGGTFRMDVALARKCAATFLGFADALDPPIDHSRRTHTLTGFGAFDSARQLQHGFESKAVELTETLTTLRDSALHMAAAYLLAAGLIQASDDSHARALLAATAGL
ncbi:MAG: hypothetical protein JWN03_380 [Nocardia sp.]|uniref:hypothetical protein n=1 Tax=Nocardia sp. TaxID=1821 RepID=UPI00261C8C2A|nr:hypothetical protein [Nocardia sp.]MCU1640105.1 hypothetical protein [Nocardia sp.]